MWRAFFCALGAMLIILGVEFLIIDSAIWAAKPLPPVNENPGFFSAPIAQRSGDVFRPSEWMPWSALLSGGVVLLYALSIKNQGNG